MIFNQHVERRMGLRQRYVLEALAIVGAVVGAAVSATGAIASAQAQSNSAKYNAQVESNNAGAAAQQAQYDAQQISDKTRRNVANQRAAMAASGFDPNSGTFKDVTYDTNQQGERDRLSRMYQGRLGVNRSQSQAQLDSSQGSNALTAGYLGAGSSILGAANQAASIASNPNFNSP